MNAVDFIGKIQKYAKITSDFGALEVPSGTTLQRPSTPKEGMWRLNTDINDYEMYLGGSWYTLESYIALKSPKIINNKTYFIGGF